MFCSLVNYIECIACYCNPVPFSAIRLFQPPVRINRLTTETARTTVNKSFQTVSNRSETVLKLFCFQFHFVVRTVYVHRAKGWCTLFLHYSPHHYCHCQPSSWYVCASAAYCQCQQCKQRNRSHARRDCGVQQWSRMQTYRLVGHENRISMKCGCMASRPHAEPSIHFCSRILKEF